MNVYIRKWAINMKNKNARYKIAGLTFHRAINYGALLQTYALQEIFEQMGCDYEVLDYRNPVLEGKHRTKNIKDIREIKDIYRFLFYWDKYNAKYDKFREFSSEYLNLSKPYYNINELKRTNSEYDCFVCGSDQVWNYKITDFDRAYFLDFVEDNIKKNSYAASFGISNIPSDQSDKYKILLKDFNNLSVREEQGKEIVKKLINRDAEVVLDPTMLIEKNKWELLASAYRKKDYILVYRFGNSKNMDMFIKQLSEETNCEIVIISCSLRRTLKATYEKVVGPLEFLGLFKNARYVVTNSFHGTAFSINLNKDFFLEMLPENEGVNSRLVNILNLFNLKSRLIIDGKNDFIHKHIDYGKVNPKLNEERLKSMDFILKMLASLDKG